MDFMTTADLSTTINLDLTRDEDEKIEAMLREAADFATAEMMRACLPPFMTTQTDSYAPAKAQEDASRQMLGWG